MEEFIFTANIVLPLFFLIIVGFALKKIKLIDEHFLTVGNKLSFRFIIPILLFYNIYSNEAHSNFDGKFGLLLFLGIFVAFLVLWAVLRLFYKDVRKLSVMIQGGFRANFVVFGVYILDNLYGVSGVATVSCYLAIVVGSYNLFATFILEYYDVAGNNSILKILKKVLTNPMILASIVGVLVSVTNIHFGTIIDKLLSQIASIATVFAMLCMGGNLNFDKLKKDKWNILIESAIKLVISPLIMTFIFYMLGYRNEMLAIAMITFAAPVAVNSYIMAKEKNADSELAAGIVAGTTLISTVTLFAFIYIGKILQIL